MIFTLLGALALLAAVTSSRWTPPARLANGIDRAERALRRFGPLAIGVASALVVWWVWDQIVPLPIVHDESSYMLQAEIFARGRWTVPSPPIPAFFEQPHVQVLPAVASKYPPGHALILSIGVLVGFPTLMPLLLTAMTGALLFALVARLGNAWVALMAWAFWISAPIVLRYQPSYFSELTTSLLMLASWWTLLEWRETRKRRWLLLMAFAIGWGAITRPLTMLAVAIPIGVVVVREVIRLRLWRDFGLAVVVGCAVLSLLPLWNARTTGNWRLSAIELYRRDYLPFDKMGFTADTSPPRRAASMSPVLTSLYDGFIVVHREQTLDVLPLTAALRTLKLVIGFFQGPRLALLLFAVVGLFATRALRFAALSALLIFVVYLPYAHWSGWIVYYLEITPVIAALTAFGVWRAARRIAATDHGAKLGVLGVTAVLIGIAIPGFRQGRDEQRGLQALYRGFFDRVKKLPSQPAILFVKYSSRYSNHISVVYNFADLERAPVWVVHDLGERNVLLQRLAPNRSTQLFEEDWLAPR